MARDGTPAILTLRSRPGVVHADPHSCIERSAHSSWSHLPAQQPHGRARMPGLSWFSRGLWSLHCCFEPWEDTLRLMQQCPSTSSYDSPQRRYQRTTSTFTSRGNRKPVNAERGGRAGPTRQMRRMCERRRLHPMQRPNRSPITLWQATG